jgi:hypothetical protein
MLKPILMKSFVASCLAPCLLAGLMLLLSTCTDNDRNNTCAVNDPVHDLPWLKTIIETYQRSNYMDVTIEQGTYRFQTVFIIDLCCTTCYIMPPPVFTCEGVALNTLSPGDKNIKNKKVIWKTDDDEIGCR